MNTVSNILFWISNGLLVPVVILLLLFFLKALLTIVNFFGEYWRRVKQQQAVGKLLEEASPADVVEKMQALPAKVKSPMLACMGSLLEHRDNQAYCERLLANYEVDAEKELGQCRSLLKLGPMLGLMGTLIPMGPALVGLAAGDITSMAYNMQVAFATTVVGIMTAVIGIITLQVKQRWYAHELNDLEYIYKLLHP
ncbi:MAG: MotA/TolQ/ExbB proton channel family protein [Bacteroidaceae bacterium]|nr:MotA/TolQ/ExbB proton channel family protein [Bacteroidaceae bacterium]